MYYNTMNGTADLNATLLAPAPVASQKACDQEQRSLLAAEQKPNLGNGLYTALQNHGGWRVDPNAWCPYHGVMQLFGPWMPIEGPWIHLQIKETNPSQRRRLADQQWLFQAHQDHIHAARQGCYFRN